ncbi:hypothetical protein D3C84_61480 [compost metagenome]
MYSQTGGVQLPVSPTQVDGSCFNQQLPQGNDVWPQVQFNQGADTQLGSYAIALFRTYAQTRAQKTQIHCFCYNLLQMNRFQNQFWQTWCQYVVDFADFLVRGQGQPPQQAADKAASRIYQSMLASVANQYPAVKQMLDGQTQAGLADALGVANAITNDINNFKARLSGGMGMGGAPGMGMGVGGGQPSHTQHVNAFAVSGIGQSTNTFNNPAGPAETGAAGMLLLGEEKAPVSKPTSSWGGGVNSNIQQQQPVQGLAPQPGAAASAPHKGDASDIIDHIHNAPISVEDVKVDPNFYVPKGLVVDSLRPFDHIRNPGGVEIRPAYQVPKWKRTVGSDVPYAKLYNPNTHICFLAKWVDGIIKEVVVPFTPEMDYLKHEINEELRRKAMRPKGIVVPLAKYAQSDDQTVKTVEQTREAMADGSVVAAHLSPVALEGYITGTTDLENEAMARSQVVEALGLGVDDPVPPHEYITARMHELDITEACYDKLYAFSNFTTPAEVVAALKELLESGALSLRYFTFINKRLTDAVNDFLRDSLSIEKIAIGDYFEDAVALGPYLAKKRGQEYQVTYEGNTASIVGRSLWVACEESEVAEGEASAKNYGIIDEFLNFQLGIPSEELSNLNLSEEACLVTPQSHPHLITALRAMAARATENNTVTRTRMRIITSDGFYYNVIVGKLVKGALLLKKA